MYLVAARARTGAFPLAVLKVVVAPVSSARAVRQAYARLLGIVAAVGADLAYQRTHAPIRLYLNIEPCFEKQAQSVYAFACKRHAKGLHVSVGELYDNARVALLSLSKRGGPGLPGRPTQEKCSD